MAGINGGVISFGPAKQLTYEFRITTAGIIMLVFAAIGLLFLGLTPSVPTAIPFYFVGMLFFIMGINWAVIRYRQKKFMQQLEPDFHRMKQVFAQPR